MGQPTLSAEVPTDPHRGPWLALVNFFQSLQARCNESAGDEGWAGSKARKARKAGFRSRRRRGSARRRGWRLRVSGLRPPLPSTHARSGPLEASREGGRAGGRQGGCSGVPCSPAPLCAVALDSRPPPALRPRRAASPQPLRHSLDPAVHGLIAGGRERAGGTRGGRRRRRPRRA